MEPVTNSCRNLSRVKWQWKSNSDPWSETEEAHWESYSPEQNYLIEKAYHEKRKEVDIGDYIVSTQHMVQSKKGNTPLQRPIRRKDYEEEEEIDVRSERYFESELPKTINKIFGSLQHFINFFSRRNPEILDLTKQFQEFELKNNLDGFNKVIRPQLIHCLEKELLKPIEDLLKDASIKTLQKKSKLDAKRRSEKLISLFKKEFISFEEFYGSILKSYTMNTSLYLNLNQYLRNESWTAAENLLPYVICLCKAFFSQKLNSNSQKNEEESLITLYRGTALDEFARSSYQAEKGLKFFSWNSVTSTSTNRRMAEKFMYASANIEKNKYPVLFTIEIPVEMEQKGSEYMKWIDIHQYSAIPHEDEVVLAPGCAFELEDVSTDQEKRTIIKLKLRHEVESLAHGGLIMQGALQTEMMIDKQVKIVCLEGEELSETFKNIFGNKLIEEIEFCVCTFNRWTLEEMIIALSSLEKAKRLVFISCKYEDEQGISTQRLKGIKKLKKLDIECKAMKMNNFLLQGLGYLSQLASLTLDFSHSYQEITVEEVENREFQGFKYLSELDSLTLNFADEKLISQKGLKSLASKGLKYLTQLTSLTLKCQQITNEGIQGLVSEVLKHLTQLTSLTISFGNFGRNSSITDTEVCDLAFEGLRHLSQLNSLSLDFSQCYKITDQGIQNLISQGLKNFVKLNSLSLNFSRCTQITIEGVQNLISQGIEHLTQLNSLSVDFSRCYKITEEEIQNLASTRLEKLTKITSLSLDFGEYLKITNEGLKHFDDSQIQEDVENFSTSKKKNLEKLGGQLFIRRKTFVGHRTSEDDNFETPSDLLEDPQLCELCKGFIRNNENTIKSAKLANDSHLASLAMDFYDWERTENQEVKNLTFQGLKHFTQLISLTIDFRRSNWDDHKTDTRVSDLVFQGLKYLTQLTFLSLDFGGCRQITDEEIQNLAFQGLKHLDQLNSLSLNFFDSKIGDEGVKNLISEGIMYLSQLISLTLNFGKSSAFLIPDEKQIVTDAVSVLTSKGLKQLTQLKSLSLDFSCCDQITNEGIEVLASEGLKYLDQLNSLSLDFSRCSQITDEGIQKLVSQGLKGLTQLNSLSLDFSSSKITGEGVNSLISHGIKYLPQLALLTLDFQNCSISEFSTSNIILVLRYFGFVQEEDEEEIDM